MEKSVGKKIQEQDFRKKRGEIKVAIVEQLLNLVPENYRVREFCSSISKSTLNNYKTRKTVPQDPKIKELLPAIEEAYSHYYYDHDKRHNDKMIRWLTSFNLSLEKAGVVTETKEPKYIDPSDNICKHLVPYCFSLLKNPKLTVPYRFAYRPTHLKKLPFPPYLSPSLMKDKDFMIIGREKECQALHQLVAESDEPIYLYSMAGLGKTSIAYEYAKKNRTRRDLFINVPTNSKSVCYDVLNELAPDQLKEVFGGEYSESHVFNALYNFTEEMKNYDKQVLLIIDNVSTYQQLSSTKKLAPLIDLGWKILVTTRVTNESIKETSIYKIGKLSKVNSVQLFKHYYFENLTERELSSDDEKQLMKLLKLADFHTYLIKLLAKVGKRCGASISDLVTAVAEKKSDTLKLDTISDAKVYDERTNESQKIRNIILALFDMNNLDEHEKRVLKYFTLLPDIPISQKKLEQWMLDEYGLTSITLGTVLYNLYEQGWLLLENSEERKYKCHTLVQNALTLDKQACDSISIVPFIKNATNYLNFPHDGVERTDIFQDLPILSVILTRYKEETKERYQLLKQYLSFCIYFNCCDVECLEYKEEMLHLLDKFYSADSENYQLENLICQHLNNETYFQVSNELGKASKVRKMRKRTVEAAKNCFEQKPLLCIRINQMYASSLNRSGEFKEALELLNEQEQKIHSALQQNDLPNVEEWKYTLFRNYEQLGIVSNAYCMDESSHSSLSLDDVLAIRKKYLSTGEDLLIKDSYKLRSCYNDLGMTYIFMYDKDKDKNKETLAKADYYLNLSYQMAIDRYGEDSIRCISAIKNLASLFSRRGDFKTAKKIAKHAYKIRKNKPNSEYTRGLMVDSRFLGKLYLKEFRQKNRKDRLLLEKALEYSNEALDISERLHAGEDNRDSRRNRERIQEIEQELTAFDNAQE